ncbi:PTS transporter subunit EIIB [Chitinibacter sp. SCUT-21]|uniref:hypothetical protein n=1 Tax=Chitinibacter sp. SCUT-21 TaxID=2970891 RepID=UPI0035A6C8E1
MTMLISFLVGLVLGVIGMKMTRKAPEATASSNAPIAPAAPKAIAQPSSAVKPAWLVGLGGESNVQEAETIAVTRVRVTLQDGSRLNEAALKAAGVQAVAPINAKVFHLIVGQA